MRIKKERRYQTFHFLTGIQGFDSFTMTAVWPWLSSDQWRETYPALKHSWIQSTSQLHLVFVYLLNKTNNQYYSSKAQTEISDRDNCTNLPSKNSWNIQMAEQLQLIHPSVSVMLIDLTWHVSNVLAVKTGTTITHVHKAHINHCVSTEEIISWIYIARYFK